VPPDRCSSDDALLRRHRLYDVDAREVRRREPRCRRPTTCHIG